MINLPGTLASNAFAPLISPAQDPADDDASAAADAARNQILTLRHGRQRLQLIPGLGGSVAAWDLLLGEHWQPLLRPWNGAATDAYTYACFPLVPWSNRISAGGFEQDGKSYPIRPNRAGEAYPIHGDGWLQPWQAAQTGDGEITLTLESDKFGGNPYHYRAVQQFSMAEDTLTITLAVTHLGEDRLPYGLGLHPYFRRDAATRLQMQCGGLWLCGDDPLPVSHSQVLPPTFDYRQPAALEGPMIDHCFTGWDGRAMIDYPDQGFSLELATRERSGCLLMYRPPGLDYFCLEPITHPIDAFHMPERTGLRVLNQGDSMTLDLTLRVHTR